MTDPKFEPEDRPPTRDDVRSLSSLPDELLVQVVSHLADDTKTLCTLARASRFFQVEAEKYIYTTIELLSTNDLHAIIEAFTRRPERVAFVETLKILYRFHGGLGATLAERNVFNQCVKGMKALRQWEIESPYDNYKWDEGGDEWVLGDMEEFRKALESASLQSQGSSPLASPDVGLAKLERLVIHTHGVSDDFWTLGGFYCLFRHPSLRHLHISCLALPADIPELEPYVKSTPLTELVFDECEIEPQSLARILATPKNLRALTLGENVYNINTGRDANPRLSRAPEASLAALKRVAHSLEYLAHNDPGCRLSTYSSKHNPIPGNGMRDFHSLTAMRVDASSFLHRSVALSHTQAPPNLATLQIQYPRHRLGMSMLTVGENFIEQILPYEPYTYLSSLKTLDFVQAVSLDDHYMTDIDEICNPDILRERHAVAYKLYKHGINLKLTLDAAWKDGLIPPVLHGEPPPELLCVYDAQAEGFMRLPQGTGTADAGVATETDAEEVETDELSTEDIKAMRTEVGRKLARLRSRMIDMSDDHEYGGPHVFTVVVDSDDGMWSEFDEDEDEVMDEDWHDAEYDDLEYEFYEDVLQEDHMMANDLIELQAQFLLDAAVAAQQGVDSDEELTDAHIEDVD